MVYACGETLPRTPEVATARQLYAAKAVTLAIRKVSPGRYEYLMQRIARRDRVEAETRREPVVETPKTMILNALRAAARRQRPCPTDAELAQIAGLPEASDAAYVMKQFRRDGVIRSETFGPGQRRVVTIVATGQRTATGRAHRG